MKNKLTKQMRKTPPLQNIWSRNRSTSRFHRCSSPRYHTRINKVILNNKSNLLKPKILLINLSNILSLCTLLNTLPSNKCNSNSINHKTITRQEINNFDEFISNFREHNAP
jgi:hypothetical protein